MGDNITRGLGQAPEFLDARWNKALRRDLANERSFLPDPPSNDPPDHKKRYENWPWPAIPTGRTDRPSDPPAGDINQ